MLHRPKRLPEIDIPEGGVISRIARQVNDSDRRSIYLDGDFAFGLHADVVEDAGLRKGVELTRQDCHQLLNNDLYYRALSRALSYIAHRARTTHEVRGRLREIRAPDHAIDRVISRLTDLGYLDDQEYAKRYVESRVRSKGYGPVRIRRELRGRGITREIADQALEQLTLEHVRERLEELAHKAVRHYSRETDARKRRQKITRWLARRGYPYDEIHRVLDRLGSQK